MINKKSVKSLIVNICILIISVCIISCCIFIPNVNFNDVSNPENLSKNDDSSEDLPSVEYPAIYYASEAEETGAVKAPDDMKGGAIYLEPGARFTMDSGYIENHEGYFGGAIYISNGATFTLNGGTICYNYAMFGGAIYIEKGGTCYLNGGNIVNNQAQSAPAIYIEAGADLFYDGGKATIDSNSYTEYAPVEVNYFVDGVLSKTANQSVAVLNLSKAPLEYTECNGYYLDEECTISVERGEQIIFNNTGAQSFVNSLGDDSRTLNLYTKTASKNKLSVELVDDSFYRITGYTDTGNIVVPRMIGEYEISEIAENAFTYMQETFDGTADLNLHIANSIYKIPQYAFYNAKELNSIVLTDTVTLIEDFAFSECDYLANIKIPSSVVTIGNNAFSNCDNLELVDLSNANGLRTINSYAFSNCVVLDNICIPVNVSTIDARAFANCNFTSLQVDLNNIVFDARDNCNGIIESQTKTFIAGCNTSTIPNGVEIIGSYSFYDCVGLKRINIPASILKFSQMSFGNCTALEEINFEATSVTQNIITVDYEIFYNCGLESDGITVNVKNNVKNIPQYLFYTKSTDNAPNITQLNFAEDSVCKNIFTYSFYGLNLTEIDLPDSLVAISPYAFSNNAKALTINIPKNVTLIDRFAFSECTLVTTINFNAVDCGSLYGKYVFNNIGTLGTGVMLNVGNEVLKLPDYIFYYSSSSSVSKECKIKSVIFEENSVCTSIGSYAFESCKSIDTEIVLPEGLISIADSAFRNCFLIPAVKFPSSLKTIGINAFMSCNALTSIDLSNTLITSLTSYCFCGCINLSSLLLPKSLVNLDTAFELCIALESIELPATLTNLNAFKGCTNLKNVDVSKCSELTTIGGFTDCTALENIDLSKCLFITKLMASTFKNCTSLTNLDLSFMTGLTEIKIHTFDSCTGLESILLPDSVTIIDNWAFQLCKNLTSIVMPASIESIGYDSFVNCIKLASIDFSKATNLSSINYRSFLYCNGLISVDLSNTKLVTIEGFSQCSNLEYIKVPRTAEIISLNAFYECKKLNTVDLTDVANLDSIGNNAFYNCFALENIELPDSITKIGEKAFYYCSSLQNLMLPANLTSIGASCFYNCSMLKNIDMSKVTQLVELPQYAFYKCPLVEKITIPACVTSISPLAILGFSGLTEISVDGGNMVYDSRNNCNAIIETNAQKLVLGCVTTVIPDDVVSIGSYAYHSAAITDITIPDRITEIGSSAFRECVSLKSVVLPEGITTISPYMFCDSALNSINIPSTVTSIGEYAFYDVYLNSIDIPNSVTSIGKYAFYMSSLNSLTIPSSIAVIEENTFGSCTSLKTVTLNEGLTKISAHAFSNCYDLTTINIPSTVTFIGYGAFSGCYDLTTVTIDGGASDWYVAKESTATSGTDIVLGENVTNDVIYLKTTYGSYYFFKKVASDSDTEETV